MKSLLEIVGRGQRRFAEEAFFRRLEGPGSIEEARAFIPSLTFFAMAFQDILRLNEGQIRDPRLGLMAQHHRREDRGHEEWFLRDLQRLCGTPEISGLFGADCRQSRDSVYALAAEIFRARSDAAHVALILVLEATGEVFFSRIPTFLARAGQPESLEYFSRSHHRVEQHHALFEDSVQAALAGITLDWQDRAEVTAMVERSFAAMTAMVRGFETLIVRAVAAKASAAAGPAPVGEDRP